MRIIHLFFMLLLFAGCTQDTHESIMVEMISAYEDITKVIENVSDEVSANDAIIKLDKIRGNACVSRRQNKRKDDPV